MAIKRFISTIVLSVFVIFSVLTATLTSYANYDNLPDVNDVQAMAIYDIKSNYIGPAPIEEADYNVVDPSLIETIFSGLIKKMSLSNSNCFTAGVIS
jgi:hypothetical protein